MKKNLFSIFILLFIFLISCSEKRVVKVTEISPSGKVKQATSFQISFDKALAPEDSLNKWSRKEYVEFKPAIKGRYKWIDRKTLIFSPDEPLEAMQSYKAEVTKEALFGEALTLKNTNFEFNTPNFDATKAEFFWYQIPNREYTLSIKGNISFNYPVSPEELSKYLKVYIDDTEIANCEIISDQAADVMAISFGEIKQKIEKQNLRVVINSGLKSTIEGAPLSEQRVFDYQLQPIKRFTIESVYSEYNGSYNRIIVNTSQMVDKNELSKYVTLSPHSKMQFFVSENSFTIETDMSSQKEFTLTIKKGLPSLYGGKLENEFEQGIYLISLEPSINFADRKGQYLSVLGERNLILNSVNIKKIEVKIAKVFKNNLLPFLNNNSYRINSDYSNKNFYYENLGKSIWEKEITIKEKNNWLEKINLNLDTLKNLNYKGLFVVAANSYDDYWVRDAKIISLSDLGIIVKRSAKKITLFVNSIKTTKPIANAKITLISKTNQEMASGTTDAEGHLELALQKTDFNFSPRLIFVETKDDFNYLDMQQTNIETSRFNVGGIRKNAPNDQYNVFLYGDRNLYRPGEKVILTGIIRNDQIKTLPELPVIIKVITPTGKTFNSYKQILNKEGSFELSFTIPDYYPTGKYRVEVYLSDNNLIGNYDFSMEDFLPDKIRVKLAATDKKFSFGQTVNFNLFAEYLFGGKASGLRYETDIQLKEIPFRSKKFSDFNFNNSSIKFSYIPNTFLKGNLDSEGTASFNYTIPSKITAPGKIKGFAFTSVFDNTGRTVNRIEEFEVVPNLQYIGLNMEGYYFGTGKPLTVKIASVNRNDEPISGTNLKVELIRYEWNTIIRKDQYGRYRYVSEKRDISEDVKNIALQNGLSEYTFTISQSGEYEVRAYNPTDNSYQYKTFYAYDWGSSTATSFEVNKEGKIDIVFDKEKYEPGETAEVLFKAPFKGKLLVTVEREDVYSYQYVNMESKSVQINLPVTEKYLPNVYVSATLIKEHLPNSAVPFLVGHGFNSMLVEKKSNKLPVTITSNSKIKPNTKQKITVETSSEKNIYVTLAAVDEGILQINSYNSPNPYNYMYAKRPLSVEPYDIYKLLLPEIVPDKSSTGGDSYGAELKKRINPVKSTRYKPVALWKGIKQTDGSGEVTFELDIPQFNGELRLMAVAYKGSRFGSADKAVKVSEDIILEPEMPRFLTGGDSLSTTVTIMNTTDSDKQISLKVKAEGLLKLIGNSEKPVTVEAKGSTKATFNITAENGVGTGKIIFETGGIKKVKEEIEMSVRPASPLIVKTEFGTIKGGEEITLNKESGFIESTKNTVVSISSFPAIRFTKQLKSLITYPYGCIEQTVSKVFPQLYLRELIAAVAPQYYKFGSPVYYVNEGIRKIQFMQNYDGSMKYWEGSNQSSWWGSVYAAHFLLEAAKAGYNINTAVLDKLLDYLSDKAKTKSTYDYVRYRYNSREVIKIANKEIIYSLYVLALANKADLPTMNYYKSKPHLLSTDAKYLLAAAYSILGKNQSYIELMPKSFTPEVIEKSYSGSFDSGIRANAIILNVLLEVAPDSPQVPQILKYLAEKIDKIYSTQDKAYTFLALGKIAKMFSASNLRIDVYASSEKISSFQGKDLTVHNKKLNTEVIKLKAEGTGKVYYYKEVEGINKTNNIKEEDSYLVVRRQYFDYRTGKPITENTFKQGDLITCGITLSGGERAIENIIISDLIPAGFEIENPRLSTARDLNWKIKNPLEVNHFEVRDDRVLLFANSKRNTMSEFYYILRAVNKGTFKLPPISAEAMYDRSYHSINGARTIKVID